MQELSGWWKVQPPSLHRTVSNNNWLPPARNAPAPHHVSPCESGTPGQVRTSDLGTPQLSGGNPILERPGGANVQLWDIFKELSIAGLVWYEEVAKGKFEPRIFVEGLRCDFPTLELGDIDGDGKLDIMVANLMGTPAADGEPPPLIEIFRQFGK